MKRYIVFCIKIDSWNRMLPTYKFLLEYEGSTSVRAVFGLHTWALSEEDAIKDVIKFFRKYEGEYDVIDAVILPKQYQPSDLLEDRKALISITVIILVILILGIISK